MSLVDTRYVRQRGHAYTGFGSHPSDVLTRPKVHSSKPPHGFSLDRGPRNRHATKQTTTRLAPAYQVGLTLRPRLSRRVRLSLRGLPGRASEGSCGDGRRRAPKRDWRVSGGVRPTAGERATA